MTQARDHSADFHAEPDTSYLNCAYHGAMPHVAVAAMTQAVRMKQAPYLLPDVAHFEFPQTFRNAVARWIGGDPRRVVIGDSATWGIMLLVRGLRWQAGDEVVLPDGEFPANRFPWQALQEKGVVLRQVAMSDGGWLDNIADVLTSRTRVVSVSWVNYATGFRIDLQALSDLCRQRGVRLVIDASQAIGALPFQVADVAFDLLTCTTYKWLLGPYGLGFAYLGADLLQQLSTPNINWMRVRGAEDFNRLGECDLALVDDASRFDINETANFFNLSAATASLCYLQEIGVAAIAAHNEALMRRIVAGLPPGVRVASDTSAAHRSNILCLQGGDEAHTHELFQGLQEARVFTSLRQGNLRISPHLYNTDEDIDRLLEALTARSSHAG